MGERFRQLLQEWLEPKWLGMILLALLGIWQASLSRHEAHEASQDAAEASDAVIAISADNNDLTDSLRLAFRKVKKLQQRVDMLERGKAGEQQGPGSRARLVKRRSRSPAPWWQRLLGGG